MRVRFHGHGHGHRHGHGHGHGHAHGHAHGHGRGYRRGYRHGRGRAAFARGVLAVAGMLLSSRLLPFVVALAAIVLPGRASAQSAPVTQWGGPPQYAGTERRSPALMIAGYSLAGTGTAASGLVRRDGRGSAPGDRGHHHDRGRRRDGHRPGARHLGNAARARPRGTAARERDADGPGRTGEARGALALLNAQLLGRTTPHRGGQRRRGSPRVVSAASARSCAPSRRLPGANRR
jgi:hypothetical protein